MHGRRHGSRIKEGHRSRRWHHDPDRHDADRGRHHEHGGHRGHGRHGLESGRKLSSCDLQLILLALLANKPAHGYELIKSLEEHSHGLYVPSPGMIYPALTYLEEIGFASVEMEGIKKRYSLTEAGLEHCRQNRDAAARILNEMERVGARMAQSRQADESGSGSEQNQVASISDELEASRRELRSAQRKDEPYTPEEARRIAEILNAAAAEIRRALTASNEPFAG